MSLSGKLLRPQNRALFKTSPCATIRFRQHGFTHPLTSLQCGATLQSLTNTKSFKQGQQLHAHIIVSGTLEDNTYLSTKIAAFYASCGRMTQAQVLFDGVVLKSSFLWNFMIRGYACNGLGMRSLALYREMLSFGQKTDNFTYPFVLKACGDLLLVEIGRRVHCEVVGKAKEAFVVFDLMRKAGFNVDGRTLLSLLSACGCIQALNQGREIHGYVVRNSSRIYNKFLNNSLIQMYCDCNSTVDARRLFERVQLKDTVSWNSMIAGYARNEDAVESLRLFCRMVLEGGTPDEVTVVAVLVACGQITALQFGMAVHSHIVKKGFNENNIVGTSLIDMYSKCGSLACSRKDLTRM
ncbi:hypothetical protein Q3G72_022865 [Acer saccharum]|nr:hypothetical protein Q3G72_022865 [Acer saccharum]